ncbi:MAG: DUF4861 family protein [Bacteroidales bacterium]|nr:DUF4861 family protein [Bacteroidales bacterium]
MTKKTFISLAILLSLSGNIICQKSVNQISIKNIGREKLVDFTLELPLSKFNLSLTNYIAIVDNKIVPIETSENIFGIKTIILPIDTLDVNKTHKIEIKEGFSATYPKRTYAELSHKIGGHFEGKKYVGSFSWAKTNYIRVPDEYTDHSFYLKYEGPGWESDKTAYRFYLDWRNAMDLFAKKTPLMILPGVGIDGYDSYHKPSDWGMDVLKVGKALGVGSIAVWDGKIAIRVDKKDSTICYIKADGKIRSQVMTTYFGWNANGIKCNLKSLISIDAGSRATHVELLTDKDLPNIASGLNIEKDVEILTEEKPLGEWTYFATFGKQSLADDNMGLAIFYRKKQLKEITKDPLSHVIVLNQDHRFVEYYFMATWEQEWQSVKSKADFLNAIQEVENRLNNKIQIR